MKNPNAYQRATTKPLFGEPLGQDYGTLYSASCKLRHGIQLAQGCMQQESKRPQTSRSDQVFISWPIAQSAIRLAVARGFSRWTL